MQFIPKNHRFCTKKASNWEILFLKRQKRGALIGFSDLNRANENWPQYLEDTVLSVRSDHTLSLAFNALNRDHTLDRRTI